jgi:hypothetical protein
VRGVDRWLWHTRPVRPLENGQAVSVAVAHQVYVVGLSVDELCLLPHSHRSVCRLSAA